LDTLPNDGLWESWQFGLLHTLRMIISVILLLWLDQLTKLLFVDFWFSENSSRIQASYNTWIAWSLPVPRIAVIVLSSIFLLWVYGYRVQETRHHKLHREWWGMLMYFKIWVVSILSGGLWNLLDRVFLWHVRDFVDVSPLISFYNRPIFNIADVCIVVWVMCLFVYEWKKG
jgi:lipoprotein signal peptidase